VTLVAPIFYKIKNKNNMANKKILTDLNIGGDVQANSFVKDDGISSQFLKADGSVDSTSYSTFDGAYSSLTGAPSIPTNTSFVDLTTAQTIAGNKTFTDDIYFDVSDNSIGTNAEDLLHFNGDSGIRFDTGDGISLEMTDAVVFGGAPAMSIGNGNLAFGNLNADRTFTFPDASGTIALTSNIPTDFVSGSNGGTFEDNVTFEGDVRLHEGSKVIFDNDGDSFANIFYDVDGTGKMIYNSVDEHHFKNGDDGQYDNVKANSFVKDGGTSSQFLKADGTTDSNTYLTSSSTQSKYLRSDADDTTTGSITAKRFYVANNESANNWGLQLRNNAGTADSGIYFNGDSSELYLRDSSNAIGARIRSNSTSYFNGGNVGIGTDSPSEKLEVDGNIKLTGSLNVGGDIYPNDESGNLSIYGGNDNTNDAQILLHGNSNLWGSLEFNYGYDAVNSFLKVSQGATEHLRVTNGGKVGIGTDSPSSQFDVIGGNDYETMSLGKSLTDNGVKRSGISFKHYDTDEQNVAMINSYIDSGISYVSIGGSAAALNSVEVVRFYTSSNTTTLSGTERMRIQNNGRVGIGTNAPTQMLHVDGNILANEDVFCDNVGVGSTDVTSNFNSFTVVKLKSAGNNELILDHTDGGAGSDLGLISFERNGDHLAHIRAAHQTATDDALISFHTQSTGGSFSNAASNERMRIDSTGNVGIGEDDPSFKLDIVSGSNNGIKISQQSSTNTWNGLGMLSYVSEAQANALADSSYIFTTNPSSQTETAFSKFGGLVIQGRDDGNSSFAIRLGSGSGHSTRMFMSATGVTTFSNTVTATNFILSSDSRLKENVEKVDNKSIDVDWKTFEMKSDKGQKRYGVIAQELEEAHPEFVRTDDEGMKSVAYIDLLIAKIAELEARLKKAGI
jgi:hypothetical protein